MSGDSQPVAQQISSKSTAPWSGQQPYLTEGFERAQSDVLNSPSQFYPNSQVIPMHQATTDSLAMQQQRAMSGDPTVQAGAAQTQATAQGDYLNANPHLQGAINNATQPTMDRFNEDIMPAIQSGFSSKGRYGSGLQARAQERAGIAAGNEVGKIANEMSFANYGDERGRQLQASSLAPQFGQEAYRDAANLGQVGQTYENQAGQELQSDMNRFNFNQNAPKDALAQYMTMIGGGSYGGDTTSSSPIYRNQASDILGGASQAAGIAGSLFGKQGIWG